MESAYSHSPGTHTRQTTCATHPQRSFRKKYRKEMEEKQLIQIHLEQDVKTEAGIFHITSIMKGVVHGDPKSN